MEEEDTFEEDRKKPIKIILAVGLIFLIVAFIIPFYGLKHNPEPKNIPRIENVLPANIVLPENNIEIITIGDFNKIINPSDPIIKRIADKIASESCKSNIICQSKALYYFVRDNYDYIKDPSSQEYIEDPKEFLSVGGGDCESGSSALAALQSSIGVRTQLVFIPGHAYVRIKYPDMPKQYLRDGWIYLDWTCRDCSYGEIPAINIGKHETYLEIK